MIIQIKDTTYSNTIYVVSNVNNSLVSDKDQYAKFEKFAPELGKSYHSTPACFWDNINNNSVLIHFICEERRALDDAHYS